MTSEEKLNAESRIFYMNHILRHSRTFLHPSRRFLDVVPLYNHKTYLFRKSYIFLANLLDVTSLSIRLGTFASKDGHDKMSKYKSRRICMRTG